MTNYYLGPWIWDNGEEPHWRGPAGTIGLVDLRPLANVNSFAFFATDALIADVNYLSLGQTLSDAQLSQAVIDEWRGRLSIGAAIAPCTLLELLVRTLTVDADPNGANRALPIIPTHVGNLELHLGGHSLVWSRKFSGLADAGWDNIKAVLWSTYRRARERAAYEIGIINSITLAELNAGSSPNPDRNYWIKRALAAKVQFPNATNAQIRAGLVEWVKKKVRQFLGARVRKYKVAWQDLCPTDLRDWGEEAPETSASDNFNRANSDDISTGGPVTWTEVVSDLDIVSNQLICGAAANSQASARCETALSTDDHYVQLDALEPGGLSARHGGVFTRFASGDQTAYDFRLLGAGAGLSWGKINSTGTRTEIGTAAQAESGSNTIKLSSDGSAQAGYFNGALINTITDTTITSNVRGGISINGRSDSNAYVDNFSEADLVAATAGWGPLLGMQRNRLVRA